MSDLEDTLVFQLQALGAPQPEREYRFHPIRKWRFDLAWPAYKVAVEVEGGVYIQGRHSRGSGTEKDCEKYNTATMLGWRVLRYTGKTIKSGEAAIEISDYLERIK
jgi:very-short-patch-repair endonuclease